MFYSTGHSGQFDKTFIGTMYAVITILKGRSHKTFWHKFTNSFCKLDVLIALQQIMLQLNGLAFKKWE